MASERSIGVALIVLAAASGCTSTQGAPRPAASAPVVQEAFVTEAHPEANIDSMAVWRHASKHAELLVTAKSTDVLLAFDAASGNLLRTIGGTGDGPGQFRRPNGIAVEGDLALVVERDNARVQVLAMPGDRPLGTFGSGLLRRPYGITVFATLEGSLEVYVTDNYETPDARIPPDADLGRRVHHFRVRATASGVSAEHVRAFGDTRGRGVLRKVETIAADPEHDRLLVAEEHESVRELKIYTLNGRFTGRIVPSDLFRHEPEGLALYPCGTGGYWVATDQHPDENVFHVLDRRTLALKGSFRGAKTRQTDGIAVTAGTLGPLTDGAVYAAHVDAHVSAFDWKAIAEALGLTPEACAPVRRAYRAPRPRWAELIQLAAAS